MKRITAIFTALMLLVCLFAGCQNAEANSFVVLEAATSVELEIKGNTVNDAESSLNGIKLDKAIASVITDMIANGELTEESNTVLITVSNAAQQKAALDAATAAFEAQSFAGAAICQNSDDATQGKAALVDSVAAALGYNAADLNELDINALLLLCQAKETTLDGVTFAGTASVAAYMDEDTALQIALAQAEVEADAASDVKVALDYSDYLFYDVKFTANGTALEAYIDAATGELLYSGVVGGDRTDDDAADTVTEEMAIAAACVSVGADPTAIKDVTCKYMDASAQIFYDITFTYQGTKYDVLISASTGLPLEGDVVPEDTSPISEDVTMPVQAEESTPIAQTDAPMEEAVSSDDMDLGG